MIARTFESVWMRRYVQNLQQTCSCRVVVFGAGRVKAHNAAVLAVDYAPSLQCIISAGNDRKISFTPFAMPSVDERTLGSNVGPLKLGLHTATSQVYGVITTVAAFRSLCLDVLLVRRLHCDGIQRAGCCTPVTMSATCKRVHCEPWSVLLLYLVAARGYISQALAVL